MNSGKIFEQDFKNSIPVEHFVYRFKDSAGAWQGGENTRFTPSNISDFMVMARDTLFLLELKSHKGVSIPFTCIRKNQIEEMAKIQHQNIRALFILNFRDLEKTYAITANAIKRFMDLSERKSIPLQWCVENGIEIAAEKKRIRFRYRVEEILKGAQF